MIGAMGFSGAQVHIFPGQNSNFTLEAINIPFCRM